ncbi:hypothetical protein HMPREF0682_2371 [Propionibacterium acidifaciens F0233]|uniref:Uncharacterized protein n=2 Tax=Propionibacterium acidifaciens TaxID=556499 RepID=U2S9F2_9ACTN|nr:hypothetical protein [Propionibacterium acidifaciens]ERK62263.1 hypothetical protein HMPREF0682_2371 [Propionibacterium acidifaciens F0233]
MSIMSRVRHSAGSAVRAYDQVRLAPDRVSELERRVGELETVVERLDRDLDESRRLNLRAAELLDIVQSEIVARASAAGV